jgi:acetyl-CoA acetyltransferase
MTYWWPPMRGALAQVPDLDPKVIEDAIIGCAIPEAQQGLNVARIGVLLAGLPNTIAGVTVNRFCASGLTAIAMAADRIRVGEADAMIAGGVESMSMVPMMGNTPSMNPKIFEANEHIGIAYGMGMTAEKVAQQWKVSRADQDAFALASHQKAIAGQQRGEFADETVRSRWSTASPIWRVGRCDGEDPQDRCRRRRRARRHRRSRCWEAAAGVRREDSRRQWAASPPATARRLRTAPGR